MNSIREQIVDNQIKTNELRSYFINEIPDNMIYQTFFKNVEVISFDNNEVIITFFHYNGDNAMIYNEFYKESISKTICDVFGKEYKYKIISKEDVNKYKNINKQSSEKEVVKQVKSFIENEYSDKFTFDTYLRSEFNKECVDICKDIAEQKSDLNILFISGASGIGKTHLLQAVGNRFEERGKKSIYINPLIFNKKILLALQENNSTYITKILNHLSSVDIVLFDDFQIFGEGQKKQTKNFIYQIIDARIHKNKPTIISTEMDIKDIEPMFDERLLTRIQSGFLSKIKKPKESEYKCLLDFLFEKNNINVDIVDEESKSFLIKEYSSSIRSLLGVVAKVKYYKNDLMNATYAFNVVKNIFGDSTSLSIVTTPEIIIKKVSSYYKVTAKEIMGKTRRKEIVIARHICIILMDNLLSMSSTEIGKVLNKDHTTVLNALKKSKNEGTESSIKLAIEQIKKDIRTSK